MGSFIDLVKGNGYSRLRWSQDWDGQVGTGEVVFVAKSRL